jgi:hypothetical protein
MLFTIKSPFKDPIPKQTTHEQCNLSSGFSGKLKRRFSTMTDTLDFFDGPEEPDPVPNRRLRIGITERGDGGLEIDTVLKKLPKLDGAIIVTKAPQLLLNKDLPPNTVIHATITGMGGTVMEPGVADPDVTIPAYLELVKKYGGQRVVLRVDPILPEDEDIWQKAHLIKREWLPEQAEGCRVRISFLDFYPHVVKRILAIGYRGWIPKNSIHADIVMREFGWKVLNRITLEKTGNSVEVCGEPDLPCTGCVSERDLKAMGITVPAGEDLKNQRPCCLCLASKVELLEHRGQCAHRCAYCYWK